MNNKTAVILIISVAVIIAVLLAIKNWRDRKKFFPPEGTDPVEEEQMMEYERRDKL